MDDVDARPNCIVANEAGVLPPQRVRRLIWTLLLLGIAAHVVRYALRFPLWEDEAYVCANFLDRDWLGLTRGLDNLQVAPILQLWLQKASIDLLGFHEWSLRLPSFVFGLAALFLFLGMAKRVVDGGALVLSVGFFACAYRFIRHGAEAKPYMGDAFVGLVFLAILVAWSTSGRRARWLWLLTLLTPTLLGYSLPSVFLAGGMSLAIAYLLLVNRPATWRDWIAWAAYNVVVAGSFAALYFLTIKSQADVNGQGMDTCWNHAFPPWRTPTALPYWLLDSLLGDMFAYPVGGPNFGSVVTVLCMLLGGFLLARRGHGAIVVLLLGMISLNFIAACMGKYPFGHSTRFAIYAAAPVCLLAGVGAARIILWPLKSGRVLGRTQFYIVVALLAAIPVGSIVRDFHRPYKVDDTHRFRALATWFWFEQARDAELVDLRADRAYLSDVPEPAPTSAWAIHECYRAICSERHQAGRPPRLDLVSEDHPLRCVRFEAYTGKSGRDESVDAWLTRMDADFALVDARSYELVFHYKGDDRDHHRVITVYEFIARGAGDGHE